MSQISLNAFLCNHYVLSDNIQDICLSCALKMSSRSNASSWRRIRIKLSFNLALISVFIMFWDTIRVEKDTALHMGLNWDSGTHVSCINVSKKGAFACILGLDKGHISSKSMQMTQRKRFRYKRSDINLVQCNYNQCKIFGCISIVKKTRLRNFDICCMTLSIK